MSLAFKQMKVYVRGLLLIVVAVAVGLVLVNNRANKVSFWFFGLTDETKPIHVIWLVLCTALCTIVVWWIASLGWGVLRDLREVRRLKAVRLTETMQKRRAAELDERERRIDRELKATLGGEAEGDQE